MICSVMACGGGNHFCVWMDGSSFVFDHAVNLELLYFFLFVSHVPCFIVYRCVCTHRRKSKKIIVNISTLRLVFVRMEEWRLGFM